MTYQYTNDIKEGKRFEFGKNWSKLLENIDENRITEAENSLRRMLNITNLDGKRFIDIGSGSGLFSLAARRLGADVYSFDYDNQSVACTKELRSRYFPKDENWNIEQGSVIDSNFLKSLGQDWDIVYSWGVLHHTGSMKQALENVSLLVGDSGKLFIAIYNDQGRKSNLWLLVKKAYNKLPHGLKWVILIPAFIRLWGPTSLRDLIALKPFYTWRNYSKLSTRGMSAWRDVVDWVGGLPFEVAKPEDIFNFYRDQGFTLEKMITCAGGHGCNEYVFEKSNQL